MHIPSPTAEDLLRLAIVVVSCIIITIAFFTFVKWRRVETFQFAAGGAYGGGGGGGGPVQVESMGALVDGISKVASQTETINKNIAQLSADFHRMLMNQEAQQAKQDAQEAARAQKQAAA